MVFLRLPCAEDDLQGPKICHKTFNSIEKIAMIVLAQPIVQRVLVVGGTHGNELTGAYLIKKWSQYPDLIQRLTFETMTLLANPQALAQVSRYVDADLNRCFRQSDLQNKTLSGYEAKRAIVINHQFGRQGKTPVDVVLDLHSTTAAMGLTFIVYPHPFNLRLAAYI
jgi:aspartoacylase